jgi:tetratricopeptide (TPR) repeat protein
MRERAGDPAVWIAAARCYNAAGDSQKGIAAVKKAIDLDPHNAEPHDLLASTLAGQGRFEEAIAACNHPIWKGSPPVALRGRAIEILARRGLRKEAVAQMKDFVKEQPGFRWGVELLVRWLVDEGNEEEAEEYCRQLARLSPHDGEPLFYASDIALRNGKREAAKQYLRDALVRDSSLTGAAEKLLEILMDDGEWEEARTQLEALERNASGGLAASFRARYHAMRGEWKPAVATLERLLSVPDLYVPHLDRVASAFEKGGRGRTFTRRFTRALRKNNVQEGAVFFHLRRETERNRVARRKDLLRWRDGGTPMAGILTAHIRSLAELGKFRREYAWLRQHFREMEGSDSELWGSIGFALTRSRMREEAVQWLGDWKERSRVESWMVVNLAINLIALGRFSEAGQASAEALERCGRDHTTAWHEDVAAYQAAYEGRLEDAQRLLDGERERASDGYIGFCKVAARVLISVQKQADDPQCHGPRGAVVKLGEAALKLGKVGRGFRKGFRTLLADMAARAGGKLPWYVRRYPRFPWFW